MIFEIEPSCFQTNTKTFELLKMADFVLKGRHRLYICEDSQSDYLDWKSKLTVDLFEIWDRSLRYSMEVEAQEPAKHTVIVCQTSATDYSASPPVMNIDQAAQLASEPFKIFVENDDADRDFLLTFSDTQQTTKIGELEAANLLSFQHCGGITELPKKVSKFTEKAALHHNISAAVFDSDSTQPNEVSSQANTAQSVCAAAGVKAFVLKRRAIENYLLRSWLNAWVNETRTKTLRHLDLYKVFCELTDEQRAHFHIKKGLKVDRTQIEANNITLYSNIALGTQAKLENGFGSSVGSDLFSSDWVQKSMSLDDPEGRNEVSGIVRSFLVLCR